MHVKGLHTKKGIKIKRERQTMSYITHRLCNNQFYDERRVYDDRQVITINYYSSLESTYHLYGQQPDFNMIV